MRGETARWGHVVTAMATPFFADGSLDRARVAPLASWLLENGSSALVINGTTGESPTTTTEEKLELVRIGVETVGSKNVIAGIGGYDTAETIRLARASADAGAGALLAVVPYYNRPNQAGLYAHFSAIAAATDLPVMLYNVPGRTVANLEAGTVARLAADCETIVAVKEASANLAQVGEILRTTPDDFDVYSGDDGTILPLLSLGGAGVVSVISHVDGPRLSAMHDAWFSGDREKAARLFLQTLPVTRAIFSAPSPAPTKYALNRLGQSVGGVRLPLVDVTDAEAAIIDAALTDAGILPAR